MLAEVNGQEIRPEFSRRMFPVVVTDVDSALAWEPDPNQSYVIAEDAGLFPDRRLPGVLPVNYNIQNVKFTTIIAPNKQSRSSNMIEGSMTIIEPYGVTFLDTLCVAASYFYPGGANYTTLPYMLQLDFFGYDDNGDPISDSDTIGLRKRFPINCLLMIGVFERSGIQRS